MRLGTVPFVQAEILLRRPSTLGEGSLWDEASQSLCWIDIVEHTVFLFDPASGRNREFDVGEDVGTAVFTKQGKLLVALRSGLNVLDPDSGALVFLADPRSSAQEGRFNDGKCDPVGRFWVGTMPEGQGSEGQGGLYCLHSDHRVDRPLSGISCSNGICWSSDRRTMYYVDTPTYQVSAFDFDPETGAIDNRRVVIELDRKEEGAPDGMTIDAEGHLWIALFDGGRVLRIDPDTAQRTYEVRVPGGGNVTSCAFGGPGLDRLFITTGRIGLSDEQRSAQPDAGSLYVARVPFVGVSSSRFGGKVDGAP